MRLTAERACDRLAGERVVRLATAGEDGQPHLVPATFALLGQTVAIAIDHKPKRTTDLKRLRNIRVNPRVSLLADHYEDDWTRLWWVRADGSARIVEQGVEQGVEQKGTATGPAGPLRELAAKYEQYRTAVPTGPLILIDVDHWAGWAYA